jgi:hypothetical protein
MPNYKLNKEKGLAVIDHVRVIFAGDDNEDVSYSVIPFLYATLIDLKKAVKRLDAFKTKVKHYKTEVVKVEFRGRILYGCIRFPK